MRIMFPNAKAFTAWIFFSSWHYFIWIGIILMRWQFWRKEFCTSTVMENTGNEFNGIWFCCFSFETIFLSHSKEKKSSDGLWVCGGWYDDERWAISGNMFYSCNLIPECRHIIWKIFLRFLFPVWKKERIGKKIMKKNCSFINGLSFFRGSMDDVKKRHLSTPFTQISVHPNPLMTHSWICLKRDMA